MGRGKSSEKAIKKEKQEGIQRIKGLKLPPLVEKKMIQAEVGFIEAKHLCKPDPEVLEIFKKLAMEHRI